MPYSERVFGAKPSATEVLWVLFAHNEKHDRHDDRNDGHNDKSENNILFCF